MFSKKRETSRVWYLSGMLVGIKQEGELLRITFDVLRPARMTISLACRKDVRILQSVYGKSYVVIYRIHERKENEVLDIFEIV